MLKSLHIENIAVIESADIEPVSGFNALTGETGAGKSIIIDAINAVLGERTSKELIRSGEEKALVSAIFGNLSKDVIDYIEGFGISPDEDGNLCVSRVLNAASSGSVRINGQLTTAQTLREISKFLVNIHGQHDSQLLLRAENHYKYLDLVAENKSEFDAYSSAYKKFTNIRRQIKALETDDDKKYDRIDLLKFQINELETADIKPGEYDQLKKQRELIANSEKMLKNLNECVYILTGDVDKDGAASEVSTALKFLQQSSVEELNTTVVELSAASETLYNTADNIRKFISEFSYSAEDALKIDERLDTLSRLMLKYGNSEHSMLDFLDLAKAELEQIEMSDEKLSLLEDELVVAQEQLVKAGKNLTFSRKKAAETFSKQVCEALGFMDMQGVRFLVNITDANYSKTGKDSVEFFISANAGQTEKPLCKVASGGELSRIMLAIKSILADKDDVDTLIFDEIDTGISGRAASKVAVQLSKVSKQRQVICVTHLAQIAAAATGHFLIEKSVKNGKTYTDVTLLENENRVNEIARIMSGTELTQNTINSAKELLDRSKM